MVYPALQNAIMDEIFKVLSSPGTNILMMPKWVSSVCANTVAGCKLREFALDMLHYCMTTRPEKYKTGPVNPKPEWRYPEQLQELMENAEIALAMLWRSIDHKGEEMMRPTDVGGCVYHVHDDGKECGEEAT